MSNDEIQIIGKKVKDMYGTLVGKVVGTISDIDVRPAQIPLIKHPVKILTNLFTTHLGWRFPEVTSEFRHVPQV